MKSSSLAAFPFAWNLYYGQYHLFYQLEEAPPPPELPPSDGDEESELEDELEDEP